MAKPEPDLPEASLVRVEQRLPAARPHFVRDLVGRALLLRGHHGFEGGNAPAALRAHALRIRTVDLVPGERPVSTLLRRRGR
jgi:hypothetical protein